MRYISVISLVFFYIFFFTRAILLKKKIGKSIKSNDSILNTSIFFAGLSSILFILQKSSILLEKYFLILFNSLVLEIIGTVLIVFGLITSSIASIGLGNSWRVGVNEEEETLLVKNGIYSYSRNPYFLSYDFVLFGLIFSSLSMLILLSSLSTVILFHILILKEEKYLEIKHGEEYRHYKKRVGRYL